MGWNHHLENHIFPIFFKVTCIAVLRAQVCFSAEWIRLHSASRFGSGWIVADSGSTDRKFLSGTTRLHIHTLDGQNPAPVEVGHLSHDLRCFIHPRWLFGISSISNLGKTCFSKSLFGEGATLETNCCGVTWTDLRSFNPLIHKEILFDEGSPSLVLANKKLFQGTTEEVTMGQSSTNMFSYRVWVYNVAMIIASNRWAAELAETDELETCLAHCQLNPSDRHGFALQALILRWSLGSCWFVCNSI